MNHIVAIGKPHFASDNSFILEVERASGKKDSFICISSKDEIDKVSSATRLEVSGRIKARTHNGKTECYVEVLDMLEYSSEEYCINSVILKGSICGKPYFKRVSNDSLSLTNVILKAESAYIPVILWGNDASRCRRLPTGTELYVEGRLQSRVYTKYVADGVEKGITYEVSAGTVLIRR